jgi:hypothetical protein
MPSECSVINAFEKFSGEVDVSVVKSHRLKAMQPYGASSVNQRFLLIPN